MGNAARVGPCALCWLQGVGTVLGPYCDWCGVFLCASCKRNYKSRGAAVLKFKLSPAVRADYNRLIGQVT